MPTFDELYARALAAAAPHGGKKIKLTKPDKLRESMMKVRKGATATVNVAKMAEIAGILGFSVEIVPVFIKMFGHHDKPDQADGETTYSMTLEALKAKHSEHAANQVDRLPKNPTPGKTYVTELGGIEPYTAYGGETKHRFEFKSWLGGWGLKVMSPAGRTVAEYVPERFEHGFRKMATAKMPPLSDFPDYKIVGKIAKDEEFLTAVNASLGVGSYEDVRSPIRTRENTGTCSYCFGNFKLREDNAEAAMGRRSYFMEFEQDYQVKRLDQPIAVFHGYQRPGHGYTHGRCPGMYFSPFELSAEGTRLRMLEVKKDLARHKKTLELLKGDPTKFQLIVRSHSKNEKDYFIDHTHHDWKARLKTSIGRTEDAIRSAEGLVRYFSKLVDTWKKKPLPGEGEVHKDLLKGQEKSIESMSRATQSPVGNE